MEIAQEHTGQVTVKGSRFYAVLFAARTAEQVQGVVQRQRRAVRKACHHCWAARLPAAAGPTTELVHNDGEVGRPGHKLLELLQREELYGGLVVSRVFGGVKLGPAGVGRAFRDAGLAALAARRQAGG